jgi:hypothetical protein
MLSKPLKEYEPAGAPGASANGVEPSLALEDCAIAVIEHTSRATLATTRQSSLDIFYLTKRRRAVI